MIAADVVIVGGGIQGLVLLDELTRQGYGCLLVTKSDLGTGQTLHSHGLLNSGTGVLTGQLREPVEQALSFARARGLDVYGTDQWYALLPPPAFEQLSRLWDASGYRYRETSPSSLPAGFQVGDDTTRVVMLEGYNFLKRQLVRLLAAGHEHHIICGDVAAIHRSNREGLVSVDSVEIRVQSTGETMAIAVGSLVAATGTGTKRLVGSVVAGPSPQLERVTYTRMHMLCVRAPRTVLPSTSVVSMPHRLITVAHTTKDHDHVGHKTDEYVTWYVTPQETDLKHDESAPDDASADVDSGAVAEALDGLRRLYPPVETDALVRFAVYAGYKQNVGDDPITPLCELVDSTSNVVVALPSVLANSWGNARRAIALLRERVEPSGPVAAVPGAGRGVRVGTVNELAEGFEWMTWQEMRRRFTE